MSIIINYKSKIFIVSLANENMKNLKKRLPKLVNIVREENV